MGGCRAWRRSAAAIGPGPSWRWGRQDVADVRRTSRRCPVRNGVDVPPSALGLDAPGAAPLGLGCPQGQDPVGQLILDLVSASAGYVGVDRDSAAVATLATLPRTAATRVRWHTADAAHTGLPDASASVVYGEAMLTMQPEPAKRRIVAEAHRLLGPSGRYGIHELCLIPDDVDQVLAEEVAAALSQAIHVGARPLTVSQWRGLLTGAGFTVTAQSITPMHLLEPRRLIADEGLAGALGIIARTLRDAPSRRRVLHMRKVFRRYRAHLAAVGLVAVRA
ncbi:class I SAM-dependent methyltransferase [Nonomuraea sp. NPDC049400]|uniref:class I SAM-dependent methyltransferase n=1 Tax=Nonomuraea sp. NPDC049400 TaxID=3364352 RepID=UPI0037A0AD1E